MMNEQHQLSFDELDAVTGGGIVEYIVETVHASPGMPAPQRCLANMVRRFETMSRLPHRL